MLSSEQISALFVLFLTLCLAAARALVRLDDGTVVGKLSKGAVIRNLLDQACRIHFYTGDFQFSSTHVDCLFITGGKDNSCC